MISGIGHYELNWRFPHHHWFNPLNPLVLELVISIFCSQWIESYLRHRGIQ